MKQRLMLVKARVKELKAAQISINYNF